MLHDVYEGPLPAPVRNEVPGTGTYVEIRQKSTRYGMLWEVEHGTVRFGHQGSWGRWSYDEALYVFDQSYEYQRNHRHATGAYQ